MSISKGSISPCCRSQAFLSELNKRDSAAVIRHVDSGSMAVNSAVIVEYLKALVKTDRIAQYSDGGLVRYACSCCLHNDRHCHCYSLFLYSCPPLYSPQYDAMTGHAVQQSEPSTSWHHASQ